MVRYDVIIGVGLACFAFIAVLLLVVVERPTNPAFANSSLSPPPPFVERFPVPFLSPPTHSSFSTLQSSNPPLKKKLCPSLLPFLFLFLVFFILFFSFLSSFFFLLSSLDEGHSILPFPSLPPSTYRPCPSGYRSSSNSIPDRAAYIRVLLYHKLIAPPSHSLLCSPAPTIISLSPFPLRNTSPPSSSSCFSPPSPSPPPSSSGHYRKKHPPPPHPSIHRPLIHPPSLLPSTLTSSLPPLFC